MIARMMSCLQIGMKKVYFYWLCPGFDAWSWFASLLMVRYPLTDALATELLLRLCALLA